MSNDTQNPNQTSSSNRADQSTEEVPVENRLDIVERHLDTLEFNQLNMEDQLWVLTAKVVLTSFGAVIVVSVLAGMIGLQSWAETISWLETLIDLAVGTVAVLSLLVFVVSRVTNRWLDWRWDHFKYETEEENP